VRVERAELHGQVVAYAEIPGPGPVLVLLHGIGSSRRTWEPVLRLLEQRAVHAVALDLPGHGESGKGRRDYSLGALASTVRDLMDHLGEERAVLVGHSLGGGISLQFAYQYPQRIEGLVLVASGGLGSDASMLLRAASLPGAEVVIPLLAHPHMVGAVTVVNGVLAHLRGGIAPLSDDSLITLRDLADADTRAAFLATLRSVIDLSGQRVSAVSHLDRAAHLPILLVWGDRDPIIPWQHGQEASELMAGSRLVIFPGAGHEPHLHDPERFATLLVEHAARVVAPA
jgi:pimeloyl-ACP methyl ester carboxylesterase